MRLAEPAVGEQIQHVSRMGKMTSVFADLAKPHSLVNNHNFSEIMKKFKKLVGQNLSKLEISRLQKEQLNTVNGGGGSTCSCGTSGMCLIDGDVESSSEYAMV